MIEYIDVGLKYFFIYVSGFLSFNMLLSPRERMTKKQLSIIVLCGICLCPFMKPVREYLRPVSILMMVIVSLVVYKAVLQKELSLTITATIISYSISFCAYCFVVVIVTLFEYYGDFSRIYLEPIETIVIGLFQVLFTYSLFRIKRLRNGLPFLSDTRYGDLGVYLSISVLMAVSFLGLDEQVTIVVPILICLLFICGMTLYFWWRKRTTEEYLIQLKEREQQELNNEIDVLKERIALLEKDNEALSKIVHKDNKLIPALDLSVKQFLLSVAMNDDREERLTAAQSILDQLESISAERAGIVTSYEHNNTLEKADIPVIDAVLSLMQHRAITEGIAFDVHLLSGINEVIGCVISEHDTSTLLADMVENALIAASFGSREKCVLTELGERGGVFSICVSDSGDPFPREVLENWGVQRITTHADTGGSGIGMMTIYELCQKYKASFEIVCFEEAFPFSKRVSVIFDGQTDFRER